jgi:hypothetical protein
MEEEIRLYGLDTQVKMLKAELELEKKKVKCCCFTLFKRK